MRTSIVFYISGHGFGHASRDIEVINALIDKGPDLEIHVCTWAPRWLFELTVDRAVQWHGLDCDTGAVQIDALRVDEAGTIQRAAAFYRDFDRKVELEVETLRRLKPALVVGDIPPLAFAAAARAGIKSAGLGNFTWDWIYEEYREHLEREPGLLPIIRNAYACADRMWRLPMAGGFAACSDPIDVPFVARHARHSRKDVRRTLGVDDDQLMVLSSFGGHAVQGFSPERMEDTGRFVLVTTVEHGGTRIARPRPHLVLVDERSWYETGYRYEDLVAAADVVASKPGYGIIAECIANQTALLYTSRGRFREYDVLVREMPRYLRCRHLEQGDMLSGAWTAGLDALLAQPPPPERPRTDGAAVVAQLILESGDLVT